MAGQKFMMQNGASVKGDVLVTGLVDGVDVSVHVLATGNGNHVPAVGSVGQFLNYAGAWAIPAGTYVHPNHTGEVTSTGDGATVIAGNVIGVAKIKGSGSVALPNGTAGQVLQSNADGTFSWLTLGACASKAVVTTLDASANIPTSGAVKTYVDTVSAGIGTVHAPVQDLASCKALTDMTDKQVMLIENLGLYRFDVQDTTTTGDDVRVITPTTSSLGRWFKISATINDHANLSNIDKLNGTSANTFHVPNVDGTATHFLSGTGVWSVPAGTYVHPNHTGDVTSVADGATTIANGKITANRLQATGAGVLGNGSSLQVLSSNADGTFAWQTLPDPTKVAWTNGLSISGNATALTSSPVTIDSFPIITYRGAKWLISITDASNVRYEALEIIATHDGTTAYSTEFGNVGTATLVGATFTVSISAGSLILQASLSGSASNSLKFLRDTISL